MSHPDTGLLVVTVGSAARRVDVAVPAWVPVADLLPDLAARVDLLEAGTAHEGHRLLAPGGRLLAPGEGLATQGVQDGAVLTVLPGLGPDPPAVHDDPAEALAVVVAEQAPPVRPRLLHRASLGVAAVLIGIGAAAAVSIGSAWVSAGVGALVAGAVGLATGVGRVPSIPPLTAGAALLAGGLVADLAGTEPARVLVGVLACAAAAGRAAPALAVSVAGLASDRFEVDADEVADRARRGREVLLAGLVTEGLLLVALVPSSVSLGPWGAGCATACCLVTLLSSRRHRPGAEVLAGVGAGAVGLVAVAASGPWLHPGWRFEWALSLLGLGAVAIVLTVSPVGTPVRRARLADLAETAALLALLPLLAAASGLFSVVRALVP